MKTAIKKLLLIKGILLFAGLFLISPSVKAQSSSLSISPLSFELTANPGDTLISEINVFNRGDAALPIHIEVEDFITTGESGKVLVQEAENETYSLAKWIKVYPEDLILESKEMRNISFEITVPLNGEAGGHYGSILASMEGGGLESITGSAVATKIASLILLNVSGEVVEDLEILDFSAPEFQEYGPVPFEIRFENKGTVHVKPRGFITITDVFGNKVKDLEFPFKNVLPGSIRRINAEWDGGFLMGKYTAMLVGSYGNSNEPLEPSVIIFWVLPWKLMLVVSVILLIILTILFLSRKRLRMVAKILLKGEHHASGKDS